MSVYMSVCTVSRRSQPLFSLAFPLLVAVACTENRPGSSADAQSVATREAGTPQSIALAMSERKIDVLLVVDNSGSMAEEQIELSSAIRELPSALADAGFDFHVAVVSTDMVDPNHGGRFQAPSDAPKIVTSTTPNGVEILERAVRLGTMGDGFEKGLAAIEAALSPPLLDTDNRGFLRTDATLALVILSDEDDCSHAGVLREFSSEECLERIDELIPLQHFVEFLRERKNGRPEKLVALAVAGPDLEAASPLGEACSAWTPCASGGCGPNGRCCPAARAFSDCENDGDCASAHDTECVGGVCVPRIPGTTRRPYGDGTCSCVGPSGQAAPGTRYVDFVSALGPFGVYTSICSAEWQSAFERLVRIAETPYCTIEVNAARSIADIEVAVNGEKTRAWTVGCNTAGAGVVVNFAPSNCPMPGDVIEVSFVAREARDDACGVDSRDGG